MRVKIKSNPGLCRDVNSGAIINTDGSALRRYRNRRKELIARDNRINKLEADISEIKQYLKEILRERKASRGDKE